MGEHSRTTLWQKMKMWASDKWNIWDLIGVLLYIPGFVLRLCSVAGIVPAEEPYARILFSLDVMVWYIRLLDVCSVNNVIGPYVNMIGRMVSFPTVNQTHEGLQTLLTMKTYFEYINIFDGKAI